MQFRLTYDGPLKASSANDPRKANKQEIRRVIHVQMRDFWNKNAWCQWFKNNPKEPNLDAIVSMFKVGLFKFAPLGIRKLNLTCELDILFLRREEPGSVINYGGDLDNRLKTLFDALRVPTLGELPKNETPQDGETPFFCLLEDDSLITRVNINTDRLLSPPKAQERIEDVRLIIAVELKPTVFTTVNVGI